jgi:uncharacterized YigZ family protein
MTSYNTIEKEAFAEFRDRGSRFIAYVFPIRSAEEFKSRLKALKAEHPKAAHHCFAYRMGTDGTAFRSSDDGEPAGSAGKPILGQLDSKKVTDAAVVVVRYFGGTLLGVPGLINAYKTVTSLALQLTPITEKAVLVKYELQFNYTMMNDVMVGIRKVGGEVIETENQLFHRLVVGIPKKEEASWLEKAKDMHGVEVRKLGADEAR